MEPIRVVTPEHQVFLPDDCPDTSITRCHGLIGGRRTWITGGMRVIVAQHLQPALPRGSVSVDQRLRIDFKMRFRGGMDIFRRLDGDDTLALSQQDPAAFMRVGRTGLCSDPGNHISCHHDIHRAWP